MLNFKLAFAVHGGRHSFACVFLSLVIACCNITLNLKLSIAVFLGGTHFLAFVFLSLVIVCCNCIIGYSSSKLPNIMSNLTLSIAVFREDIFCSLILATCS